jgi:hypothetical protein
MKLRSSRFFAAAVAAVLLSPLAGCPGHIEDVTGTGGTSGTCVSQNLTTTPPATFATVRESFMGGGPTGAIPSCASAPCHATGSGEPPAPRMPLTLQNDANLYHNVMSYTSVNCGNIPLVNPGKPDESGLIKILMGPCGTTTRMPFGCTGDQCFAADTIAAISAWISNCAPEN